MKKTSFFKYLLTSLLVIGVLAGAFVACDKNSGDGEETTAETPKEDFDYMNADLSQYISIDPSVYMGASVTVSNIYEVTDANVQSYIEGLLKEYKQPIKITDRPVEKGDTVYIYYQGLLDGKAFEGGTYAETETSKPYALKIGSNSFIAGFEDGLIGIVPSETSKEDPAALNLKFPDVYPNNPDLAGKEVVFNVYIKYIANETVVPEYNEDTIVNILEFDAEGEDIKAEFEEYIKTLIKKDQDAAAISELSNILIDNMTVKSYPEQSVDFWYSNYLSQIQQNAAYYSAMYGNTVTVDQMAVLMLGLNDGDDWKAELTKFAQETCKSYLVYFYIAQQNDLAVTDEEYNAEINDIIEYYESQGTTYTKDDIIKEYGERMIRENILMQKVNEFLISNCNVSFKEPESN